MLKTSDLDLIHKSIEHKQVVRTGRLAREGDTAADHNVDGKLHSGTVQSNVCIDDACVQIWRLNRSKTREQRAGEQQEDAIVEDVITS